MVNTEDLDMSIRDLLTGDPLDVKPGQAVRCSAPQRAWENWTVLSSAYVITTTGLGVVIAILLKDRSTSLWPWARTEFLLVGGCVVMVLLLVAHLSVEQKRLNRINAQLTLFQDEINENARRRLTALLNVSQMMVLQSDLQKVFDCITKTCVETFTCDQASLMLFDQNTRRLTVRSAHGHLDVEKVLGSHQSLGEGIAGWVAMHKTALVLGRQAPSDHPTLKLLSGALTAAMVCPIIVRNELVGVVSISSRAPKVVYDNDDLHALKVFAENAGTCIRHAEQAEWMRMMTAKGRGETVTRVAEPVLD